MWRGGGRPRQDRSRRPLGCSERPTEERSNPGSIGGRDDLRTEEGAETEERGRIRNGESLKEMGEEKPLPLPSPASPAPQGTGLREATEGRGAEGSKDGGRDHLLVRLVHQRGVGLDELPELVDVAVGASLVDCVDDLLLGGRGSHLTRRRRGCTALGGGLAALAGGGSVGMAVAWATVRRRAGGGQVLGRREQEERRPDSR